MSNWYDFYVTQPFYYAGAQGAIRDPQHLVINSPLFYPPMPGTLAEPKYNIYMQPAVYDPTTNIMILHDIKINNYNGTAGNNFQIYYHEQAANFVPPASVNPFVGSPEAGLTNQQLWAKYGHPTPTTRSRSSHSIYHFSIRRGSSVWIKHQYHSKRHR
jgi:hypothetical protein